MPTIEITDKPRPIVRLTRDDGVRIDLHPVWLRERCKAATSIDHRTQQRIVDLAALPSDLSITGCRWSDSGELLVHFSDGHESRFDRMELLTDAMMAPTDDGLPPPTPWTSDLAELPEASWASKPDRTALYDITARFLRYGFIILRGVPRVDLKLFEIAEVFGAVRPTQYGRHIDTRSMMGADDFVHSPLNTAPHTDFPYRCPVPGIQILHCLTNRTTGEFSTLVDGMAVARALADRELQAFKILTSLPVRFRYVDTDHEFVGWRPHLSLDCTGRFQAIHFSAGFDFAPLLAPAEMDEYYMAKRSLGRLLASDEFLLNIRLGDGDLLMLDNRRLLHGGSNFDPQLGELHHQYCYIDLDGPRNLYRILGRNSHSK